MKKGTRTTLEQGRAAFAYDCAKKGAKLNKASEYKSYSKKIPMMIKTNGLGATMAFIWSKGVDKRGNINDQNAYGLIYLQIGDWLKKESKNLLEVEHDSLAVTLANVDSYTYRAATIEVLAFINWLRRFAEALIGKENKI